MASELLAQVGPMDEPVGGGGRRGGLGRTALAWAVVLYLLLAVWGACRHAEDVATDTIVYARFARYIAEGRFADAVSGHWSPLLPWCMAPWVWLGADPIHALHGVLVAWGIVLTVACCLFLRRLGPMPRSWTLMAMTCVALGAAHSAVAYPNPDVILAACLWLYFYFVTDPRLLERRSAQVACGLCAGMAFLSKAYALPFFLIHYPVTLALRHAVLRRGNASSAAPGSLPLGRTVPALLVGFVVFVAVAGPWVGVLSAKLGRFTTTSAGAINHAVVGPGVAREVHPVRRGLHIPQRGHMAAWETPEALPYVYWSPLSSISNAMHQAKVIGANLVLTRAIFSELDLFGLWLTVLVATPVVLALSWSDRQESFSLMWVGSTTALFVSGYLFVVLSSRYLLPVLGPLAVLWCFHTFARLDVLVARVCSDRGRLARGARTLLLATVAVSFAAVPMLRVGRALADAPYREYRAIACELGRAGVEGPLAATHHHEGMLLAHHLDRVYYGVPFSDEATECRRDLERHDVRTFLVFEESPLFRTFDGEPGWRRTAFVDSGRTYVNGALKVFRRTDEGVSQSGRTP